MTEQHHEVSRRDSLRQRGVPPEFLTQMRPNGLQSDYGNTWFGTLSMLSLYSPASPILLTDNPHADEQVRDTLRQVNSYTDYWKERITRYNSDQQEQNRPQLNKTTMLVDEQPEAERLNALADEVHTIIADVNTPTETLIQEAARIGGRAYKLLFDPTDYEQKIGELAEMYGMMREELER